MTADALAAPVRVRPTLTRVIVAASIGNALEWFDFLVYGYFAVTISKVFFPSGNETASLLLALGTFGVSYLVRPVGAIVIGAYTDRAGRKAGLTLSILLMLIGTTMTALMPGHATIGLAAPAMGQHRHHRSVRIGFWDPFDEHLVAPAARRMGL